ncbi:hypothetical protein KOW79_009030 [Hemibagrus wyckioides]|uniref:Uncharacterized protein n=1 Tax=Hemibagrus wyckioides TaxID=337641 RepID=A0A9D3SPZ4_9TELE|nr:hypothetical protein KOW79_009030 [Hemibagrus wyckioides]
MNVVQLVACGLIMSLVLVRTEARPTTPSQHKALEALLGEELADFLASGERRMRLLRELRTDTRAKGMWARFVNDQNGARKHKAAAWAANRRITRPQITSPEYRQDDERFRTMLTFSF